MLAADPQLQRYPLAAVMDDASSTVVVRGLRPEGIPDETFTAALGEAAAPYAVRVDADTVIDQRKVARLEQAGADLGRIAAESQAALAELGQKIDAATQNGREDQAKLRLVLDAEAAQIAGIRREFAASTAELKAAQANLAGVVSALKSAVDTPLDRLERMMRRTSIFFSQDEKVADPDGAGRALDQLADLLKETGETIRVAGHTDEIGSLALNRALSHRRAEAVIRMLVERGVPARQLLIVSLATMSPLADAPGGSGSPNRRVTFELGTGER
jgi:outer membrane protein OmpA-like peptidoglycan-associated protein